MLIDLFSTSNFVSFNIKIANVLGLHTAIYLQELTNINSKAIRKNKIEVIEEKEYFTIDRKYITAQTTLEEKEQKEIDASLVKLGILINHPEKSNSFNFNIEGLAGMIGGQVDNSVIEKVTNMTKSSKKTKTEAIIDQLKSNIVTTNPELRDAYGDWIESVYAKQHWMSKKSVIAAQQIIDKFADHNLDLALKVVEIASINGYRDMEWAVNNYNNNYNNKKPVTNCTYKINSPAPVGPRKELSNEVF